MGSVRRGRRRDDDGDAAADGPALPREVASTLMIPQPVDGAPDLAERAVRRRWRARALTGRPEEPHDSSADTYVIHVTPLPAGLPVNADRAALHSTVDVLARHRAMCGQRVDRVIGWDCHHPSVPDGAPHAAIATSVAEDEQLRHALGCHDDAVHGFHTTDATYVDSVWWALAQLWEAGLLREVPRAVAHCPGCGCDVDAVRGKGASTTALVRFPVRGDNALCTAGASLAVTVDQPAALPSVTTVGAARAADHVLAQAAGDAYPVVIARSAASTVLGHDVTLHRDVAIDELVGLRCRNPALSGAADAVVVVDSDHGSSTTTGLAPGPIVASDASAPADDLVDALRSEGLVLAVDQRDPVDLCERCGTALTVQHGSSWVITTTAVAAQVRAARDALSRHGVVDHPVTSDVEDDWVISRSGTWGTPLPLWRCDACRAVAAVATRAQLAARADSAPVGLPSDGGSDALTIACDACGDGTARREPLLVDARFEAATMPFARFGFPSAPGSDAEVAHGCHADVVIEHTGAAADATLTVANLVWDATSFDAVLTVGGRPAEAGGGPDVATLCATHGADAVRWAAVTAPSRWRTGDACDALARDAADTVIAPLRAACAAFEAAAADWTPADALDVAPVGQRHTWDRWILAELAEAVTVARRRLDGLDIAGAGQRIAGFVAHLTTWRSQRTPDDRGDPADDHAGAIATFHECLVTVAALLAPYMPFLSDEVFERLVRAHDPATPDSVHLLRYPVPDPAAVDDDLRRAPPATGTRDLRLVPDVIRTVDGVPAPLGDGSARMALRRAATA
jgi:isoleucyl-tRNA synthetase